MDRSNVIYLLNFNHQQDDDGVFRLPDNSTSMKEVYCDVKSITQTEWFNAGRNGIEHPAFVFIINRNEYDGEEAVLFNGQQYGVYRTYEAKNENLELYCEAKGGLHVGGA